MKSFTTKSTLFLFRLALLTFSNVRSFSLEQNIWFIGLFIMIFANVLSLSNFIFYSCLFHGFKGLIKVIEDYAFIVLLRLNYTLCCQLILLKFCVLFCF